MVDVNILNDAKLLEKAKEERRRKSREFIKKKREDFKKEHGISYDLYLQMRRMKEGE